MSADYTPAIVARFWSKVDQSGGPGACWPWLGHRTPRGYGMTGGKKAARVAWELTHGPILNGLFVCHNCPGGDNPTCCNPAHCFLGTNIDNLRDAALKRRLEKKLTARMVIEIRQMLAAGVTQRELAARFGVSKSLIVGIKNRTHWAHVEDRVSRRVTQR